MKTLEFILDLSCILNTIAWLLLPVITFIYLPLVYNRKYRRRDARFGPSSLLIREKK